MRSMMSRQMRFSSRASYIGFTSGRQATSASLRCFCPLPSPKARGELSSIQCATGRMMSAKEAVSEYLISSEMQVSAARITSMAVGRLPRVCMKLLHVANMRRGFTGISRAAW